MRDCAADRLVVVAARLVMADWKRFWAAPRPERMSSTLAMALSRVARAVLATPVETVKVLTPSVEVLTLDSDRLIVSPSLAPTWILMVVVLDDPSSTLMPLKLVCEPTRLISARRWVISFWMEAKSVLVLVPLAACTVNWRMRCRLSLTWPSALSAVCEIEMPSFALRWAWDRPVICEPIRLAIAWPAASSAAELMRRPDDRRSIAVCRAPWERFRFCWPIRAVMLVLMTAMTLSFRVVVGLRAALAAFLKRSVRVSASAESPRCQPS